MRLDIELEAARAVTLLCQLVDAHQSPRKSEVLTFNKPRKLEREAIMRIYGTSLHHVPHMKILAINIDKDQN